MRQDKRYNPAPLPLADLVNQAFQKHGWSRQSEHRLVFASWERIIPQHYLGRCRAVSFRAGRLIVVVDSSPLLEELRGFRQEEFLSLLNQDLARGGQAQAMVNRLEFRRG